VLPRQVMAGTAVKNRRKRKNTAAEGCGSEQNVNRIILMYNAGAIGKLFRTLQRSSLNSSSWSKYFEESCASQ
jgi:hypothetical protein